MIHRLSYEAVDRTLCDIMNVPTIGPQYKPFVNMRIISDPVNTATNFNDMTFTEWVLSVGDGTLPTQKIQHTTENDWIQIPSSLLIPESDNPISDLANIVYHDLPTSFGSMAYIKQRAIVTPTNQAVSEINSYLLNEIPGDPKTYYSSDTIASENANTSILQEQYPPEFLNSLSFNGAPEHEITLKPFTPIMLLRNLSPSNGLCNGTRILVTKLGENVIYGLIIGGTLEGSPVAIPRIVLEITNRRWPFTLRRRQFPIRLCYAMTINKSQGQTLEQIGVLLTRPVFSHGQLYVAISRVRSAKGLHIAVANTDGKYRDFTRNIVYREVFEELE
ncbi:unnamed protein product [Linum tenue]|uniref:DNA helicase Pif1-like 2B domain-containing protein n=1 Tax=Linum tenue TaxID=586396 RepID=A0AAV0IG46_9ROSI|nr:unnamed protein product [Linum tenue]